MENRMNFFSMSQSSSANMSVSNTLSHFSHVSFEEQKGQTIEKDEDEAYIFTALRTILQKALQKKGCIVFGRLEYFVCIGCITVPNPLYTEADPKHSVIFAAGGWVRDKLLNLKSNDIDFIVPNQMVELFANSMEIHLRHMYEEENGKILEWEPTPLRTLTYSKVTLSLKRINLTINRGEPDEQSFKIDFRELGPNETLIEDCKRRDFRMNSLYYDVWSNKVVDLVGIWTEGMNDIKTKSISCHNSHEETFKEDISRYYRAVRFQVTKNMQLKPELKAYIEKFGYAHMKQGQDKQSSYKKELKQIFADEPNFYPMVYWLIKFRLIPEQPLLIFQF